MEEKIIQFGTGKFLRGFSDWMIDDLNKQGLFNGSIIAVQSTDSKNAEILKKQNYKYSVVTCGLSSGVPQEKVYTIECISRIIKAKDEWEEVINCARIPSLRFVISNTTEAGIIYDENDNYVLHATFPAKVTVFLYERYKHFNSDQSKGMVFLPCELVENNGDTLKECILKYANQWALGVEFHSWIENCNIFLNTLVDSITTEPSSEKKAEMLEKSGIDDRLVVIREKYYIWVIENKINLFKYIPFELGGLNVILTDDIERYRRMKVRILNGLHTIMTAMALTCGVETVREAVEHEVIGKLLQDICYNEIIPSLSDDETELKDFADSTLQRFRNPYIEHKLQSISLNNWSKLNVRVMPSIIEYYENKKSLPVKLIFSIAMHIYFYKVCKIREDTKYSDFFDQLWNCYDLGDLSLEELLNKALGEVKVYSGIFDSQDFKALILHYLRDILDSGPLDAMKKAIK